jgi:hypothetical protein
VDVTIVSEFERGPDEYHWRLSNGLRIVRRLSLNTPKGYRLATHRHTPYAVEYDIANDEDGRRRYEGVALSYGLIYSGIEMIVTDLLTDGQSRVTAPDLAAADAYVLKQAKLMDAR